MSDPLARSPLGWRRAGVGRVHITHNGRPVADLRGHHAKDVVERLPKLGEAEGQQLLAGLLAKGRKRPRR